ncbi:GTPase IMAP family member GIMD1-like [Xyrichtys novacula]|uniref:GTPase IMAP family member GIMD1-like n=1 Tax=Xyrichtys novacula TaxID=13765 RepID=A0AAV1EHV9_XYRNO|nr:GTPase IMAP family member GIMD1-like [Xyrichtys novacula]
MATTCSGILSGFGRHGDERKVLALNVLLLGERQSGRSSVGNALIGGEEFQTGVCISGSSTTPEFQLRSRNFQNFFRRQGAESDLLLRVLDTPPMMAHPQNVHQFFPEGVHVLVLVVRANLTNEKTHLEERAEALLGPEWRRHTVLVLTFADQLKKAGLRTEHFLTQCSDWLRALAEKVEGGAFFLDNISDWPSIRGQPLREQLLRLSARNRHGALEVSP